MNGACIIETRPFANLDKIIKDHLQYLPDDWGLTIYYSRRNKHLIEGVDFGRETHLILIDDINVDQYNNMLKNPHFWSSLPYEKTLIFQSDSMLLKKGIEKFLEFDYVGAPWNFQEHGGNGGLSLRDNKVMVEVCKNASFTRRNEDVEICNYMFTEKIGSLAPRKVCEEFSTEAIFNLGSLGYHAIDNWLTDDKCNLIRLQYKK